MDVTGPCSSSSQIIWGVAVRENAKPVQTPPLHSSVKVKSYWKKKKKNEVRMREVKEHCPGAKTSRSNSTYISVPQLNIEVGCPCQNKLYTLYNFSEEGCWPWRQQKVSWIKNDSSLLREAYSQWVNGYTVEDTREGRTQFHCGTMWIQRAKCWFNLWMPGENIRRIPVSTVGSFCFGPLSTQDWQFLCNVYFNLFDLWIADIY